MVESTALLAQQHASHHGGARGPQTTAKRDWVLDVHMGLHREGTLLVASQDVEGHSSQQVRIRIEADLVLTLALICDAAVERILGLGLGPVNGDMQLQVHGEGEAYDVEARANVGGRTWHLDNEGFGGHGCCGMW